MTETDPLMVRRQKAVELDRTASNEKLAAAFKDLEDGLRSIDQMAKIVWDQVEDAIGSHPDAHFHLTGRRDCFYLPEITVDKVLFSVAHLGEMIGNLRKGWHETIEGPENRPGVCKS